MNRLFSEKLYFLSFLRETCVASITQRFLVPVSTVPAKNAWHNDPLLCPKYNEKRVADYESRFLRKRDLKNCNNLAVNKEKLAYVILACEHAPSPGLYLYVFSFSRRKKNVSWSQFFLNLQVDTLTKHRQMILPVQLCPSPSYPGLQEQLNDPWVLLHQAFS